MSTPAVVTILGIDPATSRCGLAVVRCPLQGEVSLVLARRLQGPRSQDWAGRTLAIAVLIRQEWDTIEGPRVLALEQPYSGTGAGSVGNNGLQYVWAMLGAAMGACAPAAQELLLVSTSAVASQFQGGGLKREDKKTRAVEWARRGFGLNLGEGDHDAAEAIATAYAGAALWRARQRAALQPPLTGRRGGKL